MNQAELQQHKYSLTIPVFAYERMRLGNRPSSNGERYGSYLYRNTLTGELIASWDKPERPESNGMFKGENIGWNTDALAYYKNY